MKKKTKKKLVNCCKSNKKHKKCIRKDGKIFFLPRKLTKKQCKKKVSGFTMIASYGSYKYC